MATLMPNYKCQLKSLCEQHNLPDPQYRTVPLLTAKPSRGRGVARGKIPHVSRVIVGDISESSYPKQLVPDAAEEEAARKAIETVKLKIQSEQSPKKADTAPEIAADKAAYIQQIVKIIEQEKYIFNVGIEEKYEKQYGSKLPDIWTHWLEEHKPEKIEIKKFPPNKILFELLKSPHPSDIKNNNNHESRTNGNLPTVQTLTLKDEGLVNGSTPNGNSARKASAGSINGNEPLQRPPARDIQVKRQASQNLSQQVAEKKETESKEIREGDGDHAVFGTNKEIPEPVYPNAKPKPADPDDFYDVRVTRVTAHPHLFYIVPRINEAFSQMDVSMQEFYNSEPEIPTNPSLLREGMYIVAKVNNLWARAQMIKASGDLASLFCVDTGEVVHVHPDEIQPLYSQWTQVPAQAMLARFATVAPKEGDWSPEAAAYFSSLTREKEFVATIYQVKDAPDPKMSNSRTTKVVYLDLCDTSGEDVFLDDLLVEKGFALRVPATSDP